MRVHRVTGRDLNAKASRNTGDSPMVSDSMGRAIAAWLLAMAVMVAAVGRSSATEDPLRGLYVAGFFTYNWQPTDISAPIPNNVNGTIDLNGGGGTILVGYRLPWHYHNRLVLGIEADGTFGDIGASFDGNRYATDWLVTVRGVAGWHISSHLTWTVTGGIGWLGLNTAPLAQVPLATQRQASTQVGWVVGTGLEYLTHYGFLIRGDYLYGQFDGWTINAPTDTRSIDPTVHQFRIGIVVPLYDRWDEYYKN